MLLMATICSEDGGRTLRCVDSVALCVVQINDGHVLIASIQEGACALPSIAAVAHLHVFHQTQRGRA